jgi:hypothetical protein
MAKTNRTWLRLPKPLRDLLIRRRHPGVVAVVPVDWSEFRRRNDAEPDDIGARLLAGLCVIDVDAQRAAG